MIRHKGQTRKRALLLHYSSEEVNDVLDTLTDTVHVYDTALSKLTEYFATKKCTEYEVYNFRQPEQEKKKKTLTLSTQD